MLVYKSIDDIKAFLLQNKQKTIGFVPTMGALHQGHLSLIHQSEETSDITICSIFINPIQFNKQEDLENYPRTLEKDIALLEKTGCDALFIPTFEEMYPTKEYKNYHFGSLANVMEGKHRPGHFNGVANVIQRFFEIIQPTFAFFGEKDFQQLAIVRELTKQLQLSTKIIGYPIVREKNGLAMSSRNERLTNNEKEKAAIIFSTLTHLKNTFVSYSVEQAKIFFITAMEKEQFNTEYIEFADGNTLQPINQWNETTYCVAFVVVNVGKVRLIDNLTIFI